MRSVVVSPFSMCLHPQRVYNKYTRHFEYVPCGKCKACDLRKANIMTLRVSREILQHRYSVMFTLTYDNNFLPRYEAFADSKGRVQVRPIGRVADMYDSCPLSSAGGLFTHPLFDDSTFIPTIEGESSSLTFGTVCKKDIQNFMKRLRFWLNKFAKNEEEKKIRYFIASEYGPKTFRPHYHGVLFFDAPRIADKIKTLIYMSWGRYERRKNYTNRFTFVPFARRDLTVDNIKFCDSNTSFYVASYVTGNTDLPTVLRQRSTKPFHLQSKCPVIGEYKVDKEEVLEAISNGTIEFSQSRVDKRTGTVEITSVPFSQDTLCTMFRECRKYSEEFRPLSTYAKYLVYSGYGEHFIEWDTIYSKIPDLYKSYRDFFYDHYPIQYEVCDYDNDINWYAAKKCYETINAPFYRKYRGTDPVVSYMHFIDEIGRLRGLLRLRRFYELEQDWVKYVGLKRVLCAYPEVFVTLPRKKMPGFYSRPDVKFVRSLGLLPSLYNHGVLDVDELYRYREDATDAYQSFSDDVERQISQRNKMKKFNNSVINGYRLIN